MSSKTATALAPIVVSESVLDERLEACSNLHKQAIVQQNTGTHSLWSAIAAAYTWWRAMGGSTQDPHPAYLARKCKENDPEIAIKKVKRSFTPLVKLAFGLTPQDQADTVSQYASVLDWVHGKFQSDPTDFSDDQATADLEEAIFEDIKVKGGLSKCREEQLYSENNTPKAVKEREAKAARDARILEMGREEYLNATKLAEVKKYAFPSTKAGLVLLMGRHDGNGNVDMVDVLDTDPKHIDHYIATSRAYSTETVPPLLNLLTDGLMLAQMLKPKKSKVPRNASADPKAKSTEFKNMIRSVVFKSKRYNREVLISLNRTDVSPVIKVLPKIDLGLDPETDFFLRGSDRMFVEDQVMSVAQRRIWDSQIKASDKSFGSDCCIELTDTLRKEPRLLHLYDYSGQTDHVVDVNPTGDAGQWMLEAHFGPRELRELWESFFRGYRNDVMKGKPNIEFGLSPKTWTLKAGDSSVDFKIKFKATKGSASFLHRITVNGADWVHMVKTLNDFRAVTDVVVRIDPDGVVEVRAATEVADFVVYMPTMREDEKGYNNRAFTKFRQQTPIIDINEVRKATAKDAKAGAEDEPKVGGTDGTDKAGQA